MDGPVAAAFEKRCGHWLPHGEAVMKDLLVRWGGRRAPALSAVSRVDHRPELAAAMCGSCAQRWLRGRSLWHPWCGVELRHAFDLYFERLHEDPPCTG